MVKRRLALQRVSMWSLVTLVLWHAAAGSPGASGAALTQTSESAQLQRELVAWGHAVQEWLRRTPDSGSAQLARGVLLQCLASPLRPPDLDLRMLSKPDREACGEYTGRTDVVPGGRVVFFDPRTGSGCDRPARRAHEAALRRNTALSEARLRLAHLRLQQPGGSLRSEEEAHLKDLAASGPDPDVRYLAMLFLGLGAERGDDRAGSLAWFQAAHALEPRWDSARIAIASAEIDLGNPKGARAMLPRGSAPATDDPWYRYPCRILTPAVRDELGAWMARIGSAR